MADLNSALGNAADDLQMSSMLPSADNDPSPPKRDEFDPLKFAESSWESAKERFFDAGVIDVDPNDPALFTAYKRSVDYLADMGLAGLDLVDAGVKAVIGTVAEPLSAEQEKRLERDVYSMPEAFLGMGAARTQIDDALEAVSGSLSYGRTFAATNEIDPNATSMFVPVFRPKQPVGHATVDANYAKQAQIAEDMKRASTNNGLRDLDEATRLKIWEETGLFQLSDRDEWLREISDDKSEIALTQQAFPKMETKTVTSTQRVGGMPREDVIAAKTQAQMQMIEIRARIRSGELTAAEGEAQAKAIQDDLTAKIGDHGIKYETITETVQVPKAPDKPLVVGKKGSTLDQVLNHDEVFDLVQRKARPGYTYPTAEAGRRQASSAGAGNVYGTAYPDSSYNRSYVENAGKSMISSFTDAGQTYNRSARNDRDKFILESVASGKMTAAQGEAELIWSTMLHETQHYLDDFFQSVSGRGFNSKSSKDVIDQANKEYATRLRTVKNEAKDQKVYDFLNRDLFGFRPEITFFGVDRLEKVLFGLRTYENSVSAGMDPTKAAELLGNTIGVGFDAQTKIGVMGMINQYKDSETPLGAVYKKFEGFTNNRNSRLSKVIKDAGASAAHEIYRRELGEVKSRLVQARRNLTPEERKKIPPWTMLDVPENETFTADQYGIDY